jgi:hypothetical protein
MLIRRLLLLLAAVSPVVAWAGADPAKDAHALYAALDTGNFVRPPEDLFVLGVHGFEKMKLSGARFSKDVITLVDFRKAGTEKRLWVIDLTTGRVLFHTLVAHGRNSGELFATRFSNVPNSNQSSLGFYVTGDTYIGKHGISLKLHGQEKGINDHAAARAIVIHGADYVSESFIRQVGRLGRSFGCPALPMELHEEIIEQIANKTCLFIYYPDGQYLEQSTLLPTNKAS